MICIEVNPSEQLPDAPFEPLRSLRQWNPKRRLLTQADLASIVGTTPGQISRYERGLVVPRSLEILVDLAITFGVTVDELFSPAWLEERRAYLDSRFTAYRSGYEVDPSDTPRYLAIARYGGSIMKAIVTPQTVTSFESCRIRKNNHTRLKTRLTKFIDACCRHVPIDAIIVEPSSILLPDIKGLHIPVQQISFGEAKDLLLPAGIRRTNVESYRHVVMLHPALQELATDKAGVVDKQNIAVTDQWHMAALHPVIMALAVLKRDEPSLYSSLLTT